MTTELARKPWWTDKAIEAVDAYLGTRPAPAVFEWGSGASSLWLEERSLAVRTVEHDPEWAKKVMIELGDFSHVLQHPLGPSYVKAIEGPRGKIYDLVAIDGRMRVECVIRGAPYVIPGGMLLLDDSQRAHYAKAREYLSAWESTDFSDGERTTTAYFRPEVDDHQRPENPALPHFFIPTRDRLECTQQLFRWVMTHGLPRDHLHVVDCCSTYEPMRGWLNELKSYGFDVRFMENIGARGLFAPGGVIEQCVGRKASFFISDPDVVPKNTCRLDLLEHLVACMARYGKMNKIGLSLEIDDIPSHYPNRDKVIEWESRFWRHLTDEHLYNADVATTFCLVRSLDHADKVGNVSGNARTQRPNTARHTSWYLNPDSLEPDEKHYYEHADARPPGSPTPGVTWRPSAQS